MRNVLLACALIAVAPLLFATPVLSASPFAGVDWRGVVAHDPLLTRDADQTDGNGAPFYDVAHQRCSGAFAGARDVVIGQASTTMAADAKTWVAAVPLDMGGENGYACWLLFRPHERAHFAIIPGGDSLLFRDGVILALTGKPGSANGGHASNDERIRTFHLDGGRVRLVDDSASKR